MIPPNLPKGQTYSIHCRREDNGLRNEATMVGQRPTAPLHGERAGNYSAFRSLVGIPSYQAWEVRRVCKILQAQRHRMLFFSFIFLNLFIFISLAHKMLDPVCNTQMHDFSMNGRQFVCQLKDTRVLACPSTKHVRQWRSPLCTTWRRVTRKMWRPQNLLFKKLNSDSMSFKVHSFRTRSVSERADWIQKIEIEKWYQQT